MPKTRRQRPVVAEQSSGWAQYFFSWPTDAQTPPELYGVLSQPTAIKIEVSGWGFFDSPSRAATTPVPLTVPDMNLANWSMSSAVLSPQYDLSSQARNHLREYLRWYQAFVAAYERDLRATGHTSDSRVRYARQQGRPKLAALIDLVTAQNEVHMQQLVDVLEGYRELAEMTTDLAGRGVLIVRLVIDAIRRLNALGFLSEQSKCHEVTVSGAVEHKTACAA